MEGKIIKFFDNKGYGFIKDFDGDMVYFHISDISNLEKLNLFALVKFSKHSNNKGFIAKQILVLEENPKFVSFGEIRIKLSNIKNYGMDVHKYNERIKPGYSQEDLESMELSENITNILSMLTFGLIPKSDEYQKLVKSLYRHVKHYFLYVTTFQGDNYRFRDDLVNFDVHEKIKELDKYFGNNS